jgi:hypothetical protein
MMAVIDHLAHPEAYFTLENSMWSFYAEGGAAKRVLKHFLLAGDEMRKRG